MPLPFGSVLLARCKEETATERRSVVALSGATIHWQGNTARSPCNTLLGHEVTFDLQ